MKRRRGNKQLPAQHERIWPDKEWQVGGPDELGMDHDRLAEAAKFQAEDADARPYRILVVRHGKIAAEWSNGIDPLAEANQASASKSTFSCVLGVAVQEGVIGSENDRVADYYPEMLDVAPGRHM